MAKKLLLGISGLLVASAISYGIPPMVDAARRWSVDQESATGPRYNRVPIFCFHNLNGSGRYSLTSPTFRRFMQRLKDERIQVMSLSELVERSVARKPVTRPSVVITVDDDYEGAVRIAAPILREFQFTATFFVYTNGISKNPEDGMSWDDLKRLLSEGFDVQNHSHTHTAFHIPRQGEPIEAYNRRVSVETADSKKILEENLPGHKIKYFAYPMGYHNPALRKHLLESGYDLVLTTDVKPVDLTRSFTGSFDRRTVEQEGVIAEQIVEQAIQIAREPMGSQVAGHEFTP